MLSQLVHWQVSNWQLQSSRPLTHEGSGPGGGAAEGGAEGHPHQGAAFRCKNALIAPLLLPAERVREKDLGAAVTNLRAMN